MYHFFVIDSFTARSLDAYQRQAINRIKVDEEIFDHIGKRISKGAATTGNDNFI